MKLEQVQQQVKKSLGRNFLMLCGVLVVLLFAAQFFTLTALGTRGVEVSRVRLQKEGLRLENEKIRAEIDKARTLDSIQEGLDTIFELRASRANPVEVTEKQLEDLSAVGQLNNEN